MFGFSGHLLSFFAQVGPAFQEVRKSTADLADIGAIPSKEEIATKLANRLESFDPKIAGDSILGSDERRELTLGFAGIIRRSVVAERK